MFSAFNKILIFSIVGSRFVTILNVVFDNRDRVMYMYLKLLVLFYVYKVILIMRVYLDMGFVLDLYYILIFIIY